MARIFSLVFLAVLLSAMPVFSADLSPESRITAVTVYPGSALVTREAGVDLPAGASSVSITGLPPGIDATSITASGRGGFAIEGVEIRSVISTQAADPRVSALERKIEEAEAVIEGIDGEIQSLEASGTFLGNLGARTQEALNQQIQRGSIAAEAIESLIAAFNRQSISLSRDLQAARARKRDANRTLEKLQQELGELQSLGQNNTYTAVVSVSASAAVKGAVSIRYTVDGAGWEPVYDGRGLIAEGKARLTYSAMVRQSTGEEWKDVELTLSTAQPALGASVPDPEPWYLRPIEPPGRGFARAERNVPAAAPSPAQASTSMVMVSEVGADYGDDYIELAGNPRDLSGWVLTTSINAGVNASFTVPSRVTILSDNQARKVRILEQDFASRFTYRTVPARSERVYVVAKFPNTTSAFLLGGAVSVYQGSDYVGKGALKNAASGETVELQLGVDPSITVTRKPIEEMTDPSAGAFSRDRTRTQQRFRIELANLRTTAVVVNVYDRCPVSQNDEIRVERLRGTVEPTEVREDGILRWEITLAPGERKVIEHGYRIDRPTSMRIPGL